ncbi:MAG: hypothetical protein HUK21_06345 [Fibrobacteraceae bacterium]|nr:hypothetical protein [Fibrobacteraceae bacterium]
MKLRIKFLSIFACLLAMFFFTASLSSCSREDSIKANSKLRENHSVVFTSTEPFSKDFIESLPEQDSVLVKDTITVTVNDTIHLLGFLRYNADKVYRYVWLVDKTEDTKDKKAKKDTTISSDNATPFKWVYKKTGVYSPLFIAVDGNNAKDTAGKEQFIRVIDTPPELFVPRDTVWTKHKGTATFPILARDSFGTVVNIKVDLDASGKDSAQVWKTKTVKGNDSLFISIPYKKENVDSLGNQTIYVIATDEDDNETIDSVQLHFNQKPTIELMQPQDNGRYSNKERFAFYYKASDADNPASLRYFIRAAKSRGNDGTPPVLTDNDLIAENLKEKSYEAITVDGENLIFDYKGAPLQGRLYWDVWVTDGYDTVFSANVKINEKESRPWTFFLGDLDKKTGDFYGYVKYQGKSIHEGIRIVFQDSTGNTFYGHTDKKGYYTVTVDPGVYTMVAEDTSGLRFNSDTLTKLAIETSDNILLNPLTLKDTSKPVIRFTDKLGVLNQRDYLLGGKFYDFGSQVKEAKIWFDGDSVAFTSMTINTWNLQLKNMKDGLHSFMVVAIDSAGLVSDTLKRTFAVDATTLNLLVNEKTSSMLPATREHNFKATIVNNTTVDSLIWITNVPEAKSFKTKVDSTYSSTLVINNEFVTKNLPKLNPGTLYNMQVMTPDSVYSNVVRFGFLGDGPALYFEYPSNDTSITINDVVNYAIYVDPNNVDPDNMDYELTWVCTPNEKCPTGKALTGALSWTKAGKYKIAVTIKNLANKTQSDTLVINVIPDPPAVSIDTDQDLKKVKINGKDTLRVTANDKYGTIKDISWICTKGSALDGFVSVSGLTEAKNVSLNIPITLPGDTASNVKCIVRATDDDGEVAYDTAYYKVVKDQPSVTLNIQKATVKISAKVNIKANAIDTLGYIAKYELACNNTLSELKNPEWAEMSRPDTVITIPKDEGKYYCVIQVTDDDNLTAKDTAEYTVLLDPPSVMVSEDFISATIKDTINLDAIAHDELGRIVKYEWGCGPSSADNIGFTYQSESSPRYAAVMPKEPDPDYYCIIRVTDDDGLTARDTTKLSIILAPPTVVVAKDSASVREGMRIVLNAHAYDVQNYIGEIVKREWSCGSPAEIETNWKEVSSYDTAWTAPRPTSPFYCVARATDDDGNIALDTMFIRYTMEVPAIWVKEKVVYVAAGDAFELDATINEAWQGINWFGWQCFDTDGEQLEKLVKYDYAQNHNSFYDYRDSKLTNKGIDMNCVIYAEETSTGEIFKDTTKAYIVKQVPTGVITAADTVYLWSGDESVDDEALYFYTPEWGGMHSKLGTIGDENKQEFYWQFSNVSNSFYQGNSDGSLDTSISEFNTAFRRSTQETSMTISLDYRDSISSAPTQAFYNRHRAELTSRKVYFRKAWKNLANSQDTVLQNAQYSTAPAMTVFKNKPIEAYLTSNKQVTVKQHNGSWSTLGTVTATGDSVVSIQLKDNGTDVFLAILDNAHNIDVYSSAGGTSAFAKKGSTITGATFAKLAIDRSNNPFVAYIKTDKKPYYSKWNNGWENTAVANGNKKVREIDVVFTSNNVIFAYVDTTSSYKCYFTSYDTSYRKKKEAAKIKDNVNGISLQTDTNTIYFGYLNRETDNYGPYISKTEMKKADSISLVSNTISQKSLFPGMLAYHLNFVVKNGKIYAIVDDKGKPYLAQSHAFHFDGTKWHMYGENELPYFKVAFYEANGYYLRGSVPVIDISDDNKVYVSMLGWSSPEGVGNKYGPIVMKYVADTWGINSKPEID